MNPSHPHHLHGTALLVAVVSMLVGGQLVRPLSADESGDDESRVVKAKLVVSPAGEPRPALKYPLLPPLLDRQPGNAAIMYTRIAVGFGDTCPPGELEKVVEALL